MKALRTLPFLAAALAVSAAWSQGSVDIVIAGRIVARIRDKGPYESVSMRACAVDQAIADVISNEDTQHPRVSVRRSKGIWFVYVADRQVVGAYPGDAKPQNLDPKDLAFMWMRGIREALPRATPVSKLPPTPGRPAPAESQPAPPMPGVPSVPEPAEAADGSALSGVTAADPGGEGEPATALAETAPVGSTTPSGEAAPAAASQPPEPAATPRSAALLLLLDAFNSVRILNEQEYLAGRDRVASNILANLEPFMREARATGVAAGATQPPRPITAITPTETAKPPAVTPRPVTIVTARPPTVGPTVPTVPTVPVGAGAVAAGAAPPAAVRVPKGAEASYARVPQKQRISRKFACASAPFQELKAGGSELAPQVAELLKAARDAFAASDFDTSETNVDQALQLMGVPIPK